MRRRREFDKRKPQARERARKARELAARETRARAKLGEQTVGARLLPYLNKRACRTAEERRSLQEVRLRVKARPGERLQEQTKFVGRKDLGGADLG